MNNETHVCIRTGLFQAGSSTKRHFQSFVAERNKRSEAGSPPPKKQTGLDAGFSSDICAHTYPPAAAIQEEEKLSKCPSIRLK